MYKILILLILLVLGFFKQDDTRQVKCPDEIVCTEEFNSVTLNITDGNNSPVALDHYYSFNKSTGQIYKLEGDPSTGTYTILTDAEMGNILQEGSEIIFSGAINGEKIIEKFIIGHNCCNIRKISGESEMVFLPEQWQDKSMAARN